MRSRAVNLRSGEYPNGELMEPLGCEIGRETKKQCFFANFTNYRQLKTFPKFVPISDIRVKNFPLRVQAQLKRSSEF